MILKNKFKVYSIAMIACAIMTVGAIFGFVARLAYGSAMEDKNKLEITQSQEYIDYYNKVIEEYNQSRDEGKITKHQYNKYKEEIFDGYIKQLPAAERAEVEDKLHVSDVATKSLTGVSSGLALGAIASLGTAAYISSSIKTREPDEIDDWI